MHLSLLNRRSLLSGALLSVVSLVAAPAIAQRPVGGGGGHYDFSTMTRLQFPPHRALRTRADRLAYTTLIKSLPRYKRSPNLRRAASQITTRPTPVPPLGPGPVQPLPTGPGGPGMPAFSFGTYSAFAASALLTPRAAAANGAWQNVGAQNVRPISQFFYGPGPVTGRVNAVTIDPRDPNIAYLAAPVGGLWKSLNGGNTWTPITDSLATQSFSCITVDPNNSSILYAGTGDYDRVDQSGQGLFRSMDAGATWQQIDPGTTDALGNFTTFFQDHTIRQVLVDPANSNNVLVAVGRNGDGEGDVTGGIFRSTNALSPNPTFAPVLDTTGQPANFDGNCRNLVYNSDHTKVYAAIESVPDFTAGIWQSLDGGASWTQVYGTIIFTEVAASKLDPNTVYAVDGLANQILKSTDAGVTWKDITSNLPQDLDPLGGQDHNWDFSDRSLVLTTSYQPANPAAVAAGGTSPNVDVVYLGLKDVYQSPNAGRTWGAVGQVNTGTDLFHSEQHVISIDPSNPSNVLAGNSGGLYRLRYSALDNRFAISNLNASLILNQFYDAKFHPTQSDTILGGTRDNASIYSFGNLFGWRAVTGTVFGSQADEGIAEFDGNKVAINPADPTNMYTTQPGYQTPAPAAVMPIYVTTNSWMTVTDISHTASMEAPAGVQTIALDPNNYQHLYAGTNNLWLYDHTGNAWSEELDQAGNFKPLTTGYVTAVAPSGIASNNKPFLYLGCSAGELYTFVPYVMAPTTQSTILPNITFRGGVTGILVSRVNKRRIFVSTDAGELYRCDDAINSVNYVDITGSGLLTDPSHLPAGLPIYCVALASQDDEQVLFVGTDLGVFESIDGGSTWANISTSLGMPNTRVTSLDFNASTNYLSVGTFGRGIWRLPITNVPGYTQAVIHFSPVLQSYRGAKSGMQVLVELRAPGSANNSVPLETHVATMLANGTFDVKTTARGHFDVYLTIPRFLRKKLPNVVTTSSPTVSPVMINGDCAIPPLPVVAPALPGPPRPGADNMITLDDVNLIILNLGLYTSSTLDLDGDGRVTSNDVVIARGNVGKVGD